MKTRRDRRIRTQVYRGELVETSPPTGGLDRRFLRELRAFDRELELHWHPIGQRWVLYRRVGRSAGRSANDLLVKETVIEGPEGEYRRPGSWLLDSLRRWDKTKNGSIDPERADFLFRQQVYDFDKEVEERSDKQRLAISESLADDLRFHAFGRASIVSDWESKR